MQNDDNEGNEENTRRNIRKSTNRLSNVNLLPHILIKKTAIVRVLRYKTETHFRDIRNKNRNETKTPAITMNAPT